MRLSQSTAYALHAMIQLARAEPGLPIPCRQLAHAGQMPERFLLQILRSLVSDGLLRSTRGVDGGYCLSRPADEITLWDIVAAFESIATSVPPAFASLAPQARQRLRAALKSAAEVERDELRKLTLAELASTNTMTDSPPLPLETFDTADWVLDT